MPRISYDKDVVIPCPDCGRTEFGGVVNRDYSPFLNWLATADDMDRLLAWVKVTPCYQCQALRRKKEKESRQGGRAKRH